MSILFCINTYAATGDAERRQTNGVNSLLALHGVSLLRLYLHGEPDITEKNIPARQLTLDSEQVSGRKGKRKPIVSEIFHQLAAEAVARGLRYFAFSNSDIIVSQAAVDYALSANRQAYVFSRLEVEKDRDNEQEVMPWGTDLFIIDASWWLENEWRFRAYILGEPIWDNVYTSLLLCHADSILLNRFPYIRHERHRAEWRTSPFAQYSRLLAALDAPYFSLWVKYCERLIEMREQGASEASELALQKSVFVSRSSNSERVKQALRGLKAQVRFAFLNTWEAKHATELKTERSLKILLVGDYPNDPRLGSSKVLCKLREEFEKLGHECRVLFSDDIGAPQSNSRLNQFMRPFMAARAISKAFRKYGPFDVVDVASAEGLVFGLAKLCGRFRTAVFINRSNGLEHLNYQRMLDDHRAGLLKKPWTRRIWYPATRLMQVAMTASLADHLILLNEDDQNYVLKRRWQPSNRVSIVPHGVSECFLKHSFDTPSTRGDGILFCGTWDHIKGIHYLIEAFSLVRARGVNQRLTILGPGFPKEIVLASFPTSVQPFVTVIDRADESEVARHYQQHDLLVFSSTYEGYGMVLAEAMGQGMAVVSTPVGCASTLVKDGITGVMVPARNSVALADGIERLCRDAELRARLGNEARERVRGLTWERTARETVSEYALALQATGGRAEVTAPAHS